MVFAIYSVGETAAARSWPRLLIFTVSLVVAPLLALHMSIQLWISLENIEHKTHLQQSATHLAYAKHAPNYLCQPKNLQQLRRCIGLSTRDKIRLHNRGTEQVIMHL